MWAPQQNYNNRFSYKNINNQNRGNTTTNTDELFSIEEVQQITLELIARLRNCKNKLDQFEVITSIASKFLS